MRTRTVAALLVSLYAFVDARADAVSCQTAFLAITDPSSYCPASYTSGPGARPPVIRLKDFNCESDPIDTNTDIPDTQCWQRALNCAFNPVTHELGAIEATGGVSYQIDGTLCVIGARGGVIDGNGARLIWTGSSSGGTVSAATSTLAMFYFGSLHTTQIRNLHLMSRPGGSGEPGAPLDTALMFGTYDTNPATQQVEGGRVSYSNHLEDVTIEGTNTGGLRYGIRLIGPNSLGGNNPLSVGDANNDQFEIENVTISNVDVAGVSIEHAQSKQHHLMNVNILAAAGNRYIVTADTMADPPHQAGCEGGGSTVMGGSGIRVLAGSFDSYGGFIGSFGNAAYFLAGTSDYISIVNHHSEHCTRLIRTQNGWPRDTQGVQILNGRYAVNDADVDCLGRIIDWYRVGPLKIDGLTITREAGTMPIYFYIDPRIDNGTPPAKSQVEISHTNFWVEGSATWSDTIVLASPGLTDLVSEGNLCRANNRPSPCQGLGKGTDQSVAKMLNKDLSDASNALPANVVRLAVGQTLTNKNLTDPTNQFPPFATREGIETLKNKNLLDPSNQFPPFATREGIETLTHKNLLDPTNVLPPTPHAMVLTMHGSSNAASPTAVAWSNMPAAVTELYGNAARRTKVNLSAFTEFRIEAVQVAAGAAGAKLRAQYSTNQSTWLDLAVTAGAGDVAVTASGTPAMNVGPFASVAAGARSDVYVRIVGTDGNGNADPSWYAVRIQLK